MLETTSENESATELDGVNTHTQILSIQYEYD